MKKASPQLASARCRVYLITGGLDVLPWTNQIAEVLRAQGNMTTNFSDADVVLVIAGQSFIGGPNPGTRQLIKQAFEQSKPVVPVFVNDAEMPENLPADIREFALQQDVKITSNREIPRAVARVIAKHRTPITPHHAAGSSTRQSATSVSLQSLEQKQSFVFICYRRDDSGHYASALARALAAEVGGDRVFFDVGSQQPGRDYRKQIEKALARCTHFVVVIGPGFLEPDARGARRIDDKRDDVRSEIRSAITKKKPIHVVLIGDAELPARGKVPADIAGLANASSISRLRSEAKADAVAEEIVTGQRRAGSGKGMRDIIEKWKREQEVLQRAAGSTVAKLANYGWNVVSQRGDWDSQVYILGHSQYRRFRLEVQVKEADVVLQEHIQSARRLGLWRWATRSVFSISPRTYNTVDMLQLPDNLLEAVLNPTQYLDRTGRFEWTKRNRRKLRKHTFYGNVEAIAKPNPSAVEAHQQMRRRVSSRGGLARLVPHARVLDLPADALATRAVFHPDGDRLAVISDDGFHMVSALDWRTFQSVRIGGACQSIDFSRQGRLAVGSDRGRVWIWDADGSPMEAAITPYSLRRRARAACISEETAFTTVSWSDNGDVLACCGGDAVWVYQLTTRQWTRWEFPKHHSLNMHYGANFIRGRNELLVFCRFRFLWAVQLPMLQVRITLRTGDRPGRLDHVLDRDRVAKPLSGPRLRDIYIAEPSPRGDLAVCAGSHGQMAVYDLSSMDQVRAFVWHEPFRYGMASHVQAVSFSPDGQWLASVGDDGKLVVGNTRDWEPERAAREDELSNQASIAWSPDSTTIAMTNLGRVRLWRM